MEDNVRFVTVMNWDIGTHQLLTEISDQVYLALQREAHRIASAKGSHTVCVQHINEAARALGITLQTTGESE